MSIRLIGSQTCPFVQRVLIMLHLSKINFQMMVIDLTQKPDWFLKISPTGKVPILEIEAYYIFESLVINEFINEKYDLKLQNSDIVQKAINKSWSEYSSTLISMQYALTCATDSTKFQKLANQLANSLKCLENADITLPYCNDDKLSLMDIAYAPLFFRLNILNEIYGINFFNNISKMKDWAENLLGHDAIKHSIPFNYKNIICHNIQKNAGFITTMNRSIIDT